MLSTIRAAHPGFERLAAEDDPNDTTKHYAVPGFAGKVGFITSMASPRSFSFTPASNRDAPLTVRSLRLHQTEHFCGTCNRLRVTADGNLKPCLFSPAETNLLPLLRTPMAEADRQAQLEAVIGRAVGAKKAGHAGVEAIAQESAKAGGRSMILIGG